ncbi:MAG: GNAT family N-acetyltransferase [Lachnospiraceae bacterium]|nr:GNAT family N-acetyltransferase [Lachnospiraceae bacterium]MBP5184648.1 GNAT family N-acetyltransferase [Lachnospiraceae bacterium]
MNEDNIKIESDELWLVYPAPCYLKDVRGFVAECRSEGELHIQGGGNMEYLEPGAWLDRVSLERTLPVTETTSPAETFLVYRVLDGMLIGCCQLRYHLTDKTRICGGNVGYEVRPSKRGKGYGTKILEIILKHAKEVGLTKLRIDVDETNLPSRRVVEKCGGVYSDTRQIQMAGRSQDVRYYNFDLDIK